MSVMVVVVNSDEAAPLVRWGARFAHARGTTLEVLYPGRGTKVQEPGVVDLHDASDAHPVRKALRDIVIEVGKAFTDPRKEPKAEDAKKDGEGETEEQDEPDEVTWITLRSVTHSDPFQAVLDEIDKRDVDLLVVGKHQKTTAEESKLDLSLQLMERAPCDTMLLRASGESGRECARILAPAAGGPHAEVSLRLSEAMAKDTDGVATPLYVEPDAGQEAEAVGEAMLERAMDAAGVHHSKWVVPQVVLANSPTLGISEVAKQGKYDLVLIGASNEGFIQRVLFGTIPNKLLRGPDAMAVAVVRRARSFTSRAREALKETLERWVPQLDRESRVTLFERLQEGSRFGIDFFALISLSTAIASLGLIQDSGAVVIGAMLVAPLMTPMVGAGLGLVQGNVVLVKDGAKAILLGFLTATLIGYVVGLAFGGVIPGRELTSELIARGAPNVLDLIVAFLSGVAAAYALARPNLSGALPGVAIAAALVPPIGTVGISIAQGAYKNGEGAALLFGTNLVAIVLGAALCFRVIGVQARKGQRARLWARRLQLALILTSVMLAVPLGSRLIVEVSDDEEKVLTISAPLRQAIQHEVDQIAGLALVTIKAHQEPVYLEVVVASKDAPAPSLAARLSRVTDEVLGTTVEVRVVGLRYEWLHSSESPR